MNNKDFPAFPIPSSEETTRVYRGLTKLEIFTKAAMQGLLSSNGEWGETWVAQMALKFAKATLNELSKDTNDLP